MKLFPPLLFPASACVFLLFTHVSAGSHVLEQVHQQYPALSDNLKKIIASALYEQKWTDLALGEVQSQLLVTCLEQGRLVKRLRNGYAHMFGSLLELQDGVVTELIDAQVTPKLPLFPSRSLPLSPPLSPLLSPPLISPLSIALSLVPAADTSARR